MQDSESDDFSDSGYEEGDIENSGRVILLYVALLKTIVTLLRQSVCSRKNDSRVAAEAEWYRYRIVADFVTSSSPVPLKTRRVRQRCTLNLSRAETSSRWCGVVVRRGVASSGVVHIT
ncbi:uncharacterized protein TNCV_3229441 [Trichonephila clavipes]|nr:uncharacterized protein TNCV_3229441 [Trichonephila clavipes]